MKKINTFKQLKINQMLDGSKGLYEVKSEHFKPIHFFKLINCLDQRALFIEESNFGIIKGYERVGE